MQRGAKFSTRAVIQVGFLFLALTRPVFPQRVVKLWSVDLSKDQDFQRRGQASEALLKPPTLDFLNEDEIIVAFDDNEMPIPSPEMTPFGFHVLEVEASTGCLGKKLSFNVLVNTAQAEATGDGSFLGVGW